MFSKNVIVELDKIDTIVKWENISDFHMGNDNFVDSIAEKRRDAILDDPFRFTSFGGDQLDLIYHAGVGGDAFQAAIKAIKDKHPKE